MRFMDSICAEAYFVEPGRPLHPKTILPRSFDKHRRFSALPASHSRIINIYLCEKFVKPLDKRLKKWYIIGIG